MILANVGTEASDVSVRSSRHVPRLSIGIPNNVSVGAVGSVNLASCEGEPIATSWKATAKPAGSTRLMRRVTRLELTGASATCTHTVSPRFQSDFGVTQSPANVAMDSDGGVAGSTRSADNGDATGVRTPEFG